MDYEEKKIVKPSWHFSTMLFILMVYVFMCIIGIFNTVNEFWNNSIYPIELPLLFFSAFIDIFAYCYAFLGIYKALQRKPYSITMLRFSVFYILVQSLFKTIGKTSSVLPIHPHLFIPVLLFLFVFFVFLFKSRSLKVYIPKEERKFGLFGWLGVIIYLLVVIMYIWKFAGDYKINSNSVPVKISEVNLLKGEVTDGLVAYRPLDYWTEDTVISNEKNGILRIYQTDSCHDIMVTSMNIEYKSRIDFYQLLSKCCLIQIPDTVSMVEVENKNDNFNGGMYFLNTYLVGTSDSLNAYWTFSALIDSSSHKVVTLSNYQLSSYEQSHKMSKELMKSVRFKLKK